MKEFPKETTVKCQIARTTTVKLTLSLSLPRALETS